MDTFARLSNLGFRQQDLEARVESYQREMGRAVTGEEGHVAGEVAGWHDGGTKPHAGSEGPAATPGGTEIRHAAFAPGVLGAPVSLGLPLNLPLNVPLQTTASPPLRCIVFRDASGTLAPHARVFDKPNDIWRIDIFRGMHTGVTFFNSGGVDIRSNNPDNAVPNDAALFVDQGKSNSARHVFFFGRVPKSTSDFSKNQTALLLTPKNRTMLQVRVKPFTKNHQVLVRLFGKTMALNSRGLPAYVMDENENNISDGASAADHVEPATLIARVAKNAPVRHLVINAHAGMDVTIRGHIRLGHDLAHFGTKKKGDNIGFHRGNLDLWDALSGKVEFIWVQACFCGADNEFMGTIAHKTKAWVTGAAMLTNFKPKNVAKSHVELLHAFFMKHWSPSVSTLTFTPAKQDDFLQQGRRTSDPNLDAAMNFNVVKVR
ncbi:MAG: hypothetical protein R3B72_37985 [Polyangiaceae bacterium]